MKVRFRRDICGLSGRQDDLVFYHNEYLKQTIARRYAKPQRNPSALKLKKIMANLRELNPAQGFRRNFKDYALRYNKLRINSDKPNLSWANLYLKMLFGMAKAIPSVDLTTISRNDIYTGNLPCISVRSAVEAGLLPPVKGADRFNNYI